MHSFEDTARERWQKEGYDQAMQDSCIKYNFQAAFEDIDNVYISSKLKLNEQAQAIYDYCAVFHKDSKLLAALGSLIENSGAREQLTRLSQDAKSIKLIIEEIDKEIYGFRDMPIVARYLGELKSRMEVK